MLNGIAPILIVNLIKKKDNSVGAFFSGIPVVGKDLAGALTGGLPVPIYLDERITGICVTSETKTLAIETEIKATTDASKPIPTQRAVDSVVQINMCAQKDNIVLAALVALCDQIFQRVVAKEYSVSYLNGSTTIFNGLLSGFTSMYEEGSDLLHLTLAISKGNQQTTQVTQVNPSVPGINGAQPPRELASIPTGGAA